MRIMVVSDTHGIPSMFLGKAKELDRPDMILHLGDYTRDADIIRDEMKVETIAVSGNGDRNTSYKPEEILEAKGKRIFLCHGHNYRVDMGIDNLYYKGLEEAADIVLFGHTHVPLSIEENGILFVNPGSPTIPRSEERIRTFAVLDISEGIKVDIIEF